MAKKNIKYVNKFLSNVAPEIKFNFKRIIITNVIQTNNNPFKPSIKFDPFIKINKQKEVKNMLKILYRKRLSK